MSDLLAFLCLQLLLDFFVPAFLPFPAAIRLTGAFQLGHFLLGIFFNEDL